MTLYGRQQLVTPAIIGATALGKSVRDPLILGSNEGIRHAIDLDFDFSYPGGPLAGRPTAGAPSDEAILYDIAERANGRFDLLSGQTVTYQGGGFDYSAITSNIGAFCEIPSSAPADIWSTVNGNSQYFLFCLYMRLPLKAEYPSGGFISPFAHFSEGQSFQNGPDLLTLAMNTSGEITYRRQRDLNVVDNISLAPPSNDDYGKVVQIGAWRNAAGTGLRLKSATGTRIGTLAPTPANVQNYSARTGRIGVSGSFWQSNLVTAGQSLSVRFRAYRYFLENLARSGRDPATVLDADWARIVTRNKFS